MKRERMKPRLVPIFNHAKEPQDLVYECASAAAMHPGFEWAGIMMACALTLQELLDEKDG